MTSTTRQDTATTLFTGKHMLYGALVAGVLMDVWLKQLGASVSVWSTVAWRWAFGVLILLSLAVVKFDRTDWQVWRRVHGLRAVLNLIGTYGLVFGLQKLPFALVITIFFAEPLLTLLLATLMGWQALHGLQLTISVLGLAGVGLWMAGPSAWALPAADMWLLGLVASLGSVFSLLWVAALKRVSARAAAHVMYLALPLGAFVGRWFFDELPHTVSVVGSASVFLAVWAVNRLAVRETNPIKKAV